MQIYRDYILYLCHHIQIYTQEEIMMYTQMNLTAETGNDAVSLWQVTTDILGPQPMSGFAPNA
jgi:hypothetical protein